MRGKNIFAIVKVFLASGTIAVFLGTTATSASAQGLECHSNKEYLVAAQAYKDNEAGMQFAITGLRGKKMPRGCVFDAARADFIIGKPGEPLWFGQQVGKLLILTRSTGPQGDLVIHDLSARKAVLDVPSDDYTVQGHQVIFWQRTSPGTRMNCPAFEQNRKDGLGSMLVIRKIFNTRSLVVHATGERRCDAVQ